MFWVLTKTKLALVLRLLNKNLQVDAVAGLLDGTEELGVVLRLHVVLHHFHLRRNKYNAKAQKYFEDLLPIENFNLSHLTLYPELHQLAVSRSQSHRCHLRLLGTQLGGERFKVMFIEAEVLDQILNLCS